MNFHMASISTLFSNKTHLLSTFPRKVYHGGPTPSPGKPATRPPRRQYSPCRSRSEGTPSPCRGGHMFAPTRIWRRWHQKINVNQKRYAVVSAIAAFAVPSLMMTRGHRIESVPKLPLVVSDSAEGIEKTQNAIKVLKQIGAYSDAEEVKKQRRNLSRKGENEKPKVYFS